MHIKAFRFEKRQTRKGVHCFMYVYSGYLNHSDMELEDHTHPLLVTGCGVFQLIHQPVMDTIRSGGRVDYQLLYISSGKAFFEFSEGISEVSAGEMILYRPGVPQHYWYLLQDRPEVYWIHFTGADAEAYLDQAGFSGKRQLHVGISPSIGKFSAGSSGNCSFAGPVLRNFLLSTFASSLPRFTGANRQVS